MSDKSAKSSKSVKSGGKPAGKTSKPAAKPAARVSGASVIGAAIAAVKADGTETRKPRRVQVRVQGLLLKTVELAPIEVWDAQLRYRVEIYRSVEQGDCYARLFRLEYFRMQPTFPQEQGQPAHQPCDEWVLVEDSDLALSGELRGRTPQATLKATMDAMAEWFGK